MAALTRATAFSLPSTAASSMPPPGGELLAGHRHTQRPQHKAVFHAFFLNQSKQGSMHRVPGEAVGPEWPPVRAEWLPALPWRSRRWSSFLVGIHGKVILGHFVDKVDLLGDIAHQLAPLVQHLASRALLQGVLTTLSIYGSAFSKNASSLMARMYSALI